MVEPPIFKPPILKRYNPNFKPKPDNKMTDIPFSKDVPPFQPLEEPILDLPRPPFQPTSAPTLKRKISDDIPDMTASFAMKSLVYGAGALYLGRGIYTAYKTINDIPKLYSYWQKENENTQKINTYGGVTEATEAELSNLFDSPYNPFLNKTPQLISMEAGEISPFDNSPVPYPNYDEYISPTKNGETSPQKLSDNISPTKNGETSPQKLSNSAKKRARKKARQNRKNGIDPNNIVEEKRASKPNDENIYGGRGKPTNGFGGGEL